MKLFNHLAPSFVLLVADNEKVVNVAANHAKGTELTLDHGPKTPQTGFCHQSLQPKPLQNLVNMQVKFTRGHCQAIGSTHDLYHLTLLEVHCFSQLFHRNSKDATCLLIGVTLQKCGLGVRLEKLPSSVSAEL